MNPIRELKKIAAELEEGLPTVAEVSWLDLGDHNGAFKTFVKKGDQWYLIEHDGGYLTAGEKVDQAAVEKALQKIPAYRQQKGGTAEWSNESYKGFDRPDFFSAGETGVAIQDILDHIDADDFDSWLDSLMD